MDAAQTSDDNYINESILFYKVYCFIEISSTDKTDNLTCEIIYDNFICENYRFSIIAFLQKFIAFQRLVFI